MNSRSHLISPPPRVSVITSWAQELQGDSAPAMLRGVRKAAEYGIPNLDLYFLDQAGVAWCAACAEQPVDPAANIYTLPASLSSEQIARIARQLKAERARTSYGFELPVTYTGLATYFPRISLTAFDDKDPNSRPLRESAIRALQRTLLLAFCLDCPCVEIVGGSGFPTHRAVKMSHDSTPQHDHARKLESLHTPDDYRALRRAALAEAIRTLYDLDDEKNILRSIPAVQEKAAAGRLPVVAMELEPGDVYLMHHPKVFKQLREDVKNIAGEDSLAYRSLKLNLDISHAFLIGLQADDIRKDPDLLENIAHMHISDHAGHRNRIPPRRGEVLPRDYSIGAHAQDMPPGTFHTKDDYMDWLRLAHELVGHSSFSGTIAVELESINDPKIVCNTWHQVQRWLHDAAPKQSYETITVGR